MHKIVAPLLGLLILALYAGLIVLPTKPTPDQLRVILFGVTVVLVVVVGLLLWLSSWSDILRDSNPANFGGATASDTDTKPLRRPFSLAQTQMAWWFVLVLGTYSYLFVTGNSSSLSDQGLILMGIGTGTALGAGIIEQNKTDKTLLSFEALLKRISDMRSQGVPEAALVGLLQERDTRARELASHNFLEDILTDVDGISLHRFQAAVWTVVIGAIFVAESIQLGHMVDLDPKLLAVMGISAGTYLGFKIPEQPS